MFKNLLNGLRFPVVEGVLAAAMIVVGYSDNQGENPSITAKLLIGLICVVVVAYGFLSPLAPIYFWAFTAPLYPASFSSMFLICGTSFTLLYARKKNLWCWNFSVAGLLFCLWGIASLYWAENIDFGREGFFNVTLPGIILSVIISGIREQNFRRNLAHILIIAVSVGCIKTFISWRTGDSLYDKAGRFESFLQPDIFSSWCLFAGLSLLSLLVKRAKLSSPTQILGVLLLLYIVTGIVLCGYRSTILAMGAASSVLLILSNRKWFALLMLLALGCGIIMISSNWGVFDIVGQRFDTMSEDRGSGRLDLWNAGLKVFVENPIIGVGWDNFKISIEKDYGEQMLPHNLYIQTFVELGLIGGVLSLAWTVILIRKAWQSPDRNWIFPILLGFLLQGLFLGQFFYMYFWLVLGCAENSSITQRVDLARPRQYGKQKANLLSNGHKA
jgi:hypothetical protein